MHIGRRNLDFQYQMNEGWAKSIDVERDLGVLMSKDLKFSKTCLLAKTKANLYLFIIRKPTPVSAGSARNNTKERGKKERHRRREKKGIEAQRMGPQAHPGHNHRG